MKQPNATPRVALIDDHTLFRHGLRELLEEAEIEVVGEATNGRLAVDLVIHKRPDVVFMDLAMPGIGGIEATRQITEKTSSKVLVLTISVESGEIIEALCAGACGYLLKDASADEILQALHAAVAGESVISPRIAGKVVDRIRAIGTEAPVLPVDLTDRELDILRLIAQGMENADIARELFISPKTVKNHVANILGKLNLENRIQAAVYAVQNDIV